MRRIAPALVVVLLLGIASGLVAALRAQTGSCAECQPPRLNNGWDVAPGNVTVCFKDNSEHTWSTPQVDLMKGGVNYWKDRLAEQEGRAINITWETGGSCSSGAIVIAVEHPSNMTNAGASAEALGTSDGRGATIDVAKGYEGHSHLDDLVGHEFGHLLDLANVSIPPYPSHCSSKTIMRNNVPLGSLPDPCGDRGGLTDRYRSDNTEGGEVDYDPYGEDDCYEVYVRTYWFYYINGTWYSLGYTRSYLGQYCGPPPY